MRSDTRVVAAMVTPRWVGLRGSVDWTRTADTKSGRVYVETKVCLTVGEIAVGTRRIWRYMVPEKTDIERLNQDSGPSINWNTGARHDYDTMMQHAGRAGQAAPKYRGGQFLGIIDSILHSTINDSMRCFSFGIVQNVHWPFVMSSNPGSLPLNAP